MHSIKLSGYAIGITFDKDSLAAEQNNYLTKIVNFYIACDLNTLPRNPNDNFKFKNCLFEATSIVKSSDKEKYVYSGYRIIFDSVCSWGFNNDTARNAIIFGVGNSLSSRADNGQGEGENPTFGINGSFGKKKKKRLALILVNQTQSFARVCIIMLVVVIFLLVEKKSWNLKLAMKMLTFQLNFASKIYLMDFMLLILEKYL